MTAGAGVEGLTPEQIERRDRAIDLSVRAYLDAREEIMAAAAAS